VPDFHRLNFAATITEKLDDIALDARRSGIGAMMYRS